ncbi:MAG: GAF domain-containing protein, partial [Leptospiraceae bacterium]|nr:GAF domain-containing protein [Leptospiraceae bacterium]
MKLILFFIFLLNFSFCINKIEKTPPGAVKGIIDLTETQNGSELWDLEKDGIITLNGEWEFYWSNLIKGKCDSCAPQKYIQVPSQWQEFGFPIEGYAAYRLTIKLPKKYSNSKLEDFLDDRSLAIQMTDAATSYEMYINGKLISNNGIVGINKESSKPLLKHKVLDLSSIQILDSLEIIINVSNFYESKGGLWDTIKLGTSKQIKEASNYRYYLDFFVFSSLLIMGLYNIILFLSRKKDFSPLFFGIFSIITAIRIISTTNRVILDVFPGFSFLFLIKIEYLTFYLGAYFSVLFIYSFYKNEFSKKWLYGFSSVYLFTSSLVIILPLKYYTRSLTLVQITVLVEVFYVLYILFLAAKNKRDGAVIFLSGCSIFALTTINDILKGMSILFTPYLSSYGLLIFLFFLTIIISRRFALGIELAEKLSRDLILLNENLENKIHERTKDLEESKKEVETLNHFTQLINSLSSLEDIYVEITKYLYHQYKIQGSWLLLPDNKNEHLYTYKSYSFDRIPDRIYNYMLNKKIPLNEQGGLTAISFRRKKPYYSRKVTRHFTEIDREIMESLNIKNLLHIPLLLKNKSIGLFAFTNFNKDLILSKKEIKSISNLCYQVAGVIETTYLLEQVEKSKQKALELNSLIKSLNENMDIKIIMKKVLNFIKVKYGIQSFALYSLNKSFDQLELLDASFPDFLSLTDRKYILNLKIPLSKGKSAHALALKSKRPVFLQKIRTKGLTEEEIYLKDKLRIISFFMIPLMLNNETIGIIDFSNSSETINLTKEDITWFSILGEQISGIINGSNLFHQLQEEKEKVDIANKEIEKLNEFTKLVNSTLDISIIFKEIFSYLKETFDINSIWILLVDKDKSELYTEKAMTYSEDSDSIDVKYFLNFRKKIEPNLGTLYQTYKNKVPLLIPDYREVFNGEKNKVVNRFNGKVYYGSRTDLKISLKINSKAINQFPL